MNYTFVVEKWQARPTEGYARFVPFKECPAVVVKETPKRVYVNDDGSSMVFDKITGNRITNREQRRGRRWFQYRIRAAQTCPSVVV